jgi:dihydrofolate reductase
MGVGGERLLAWYGAGDTDYRLPGTDMVFRVSAETAEFLRETRETTGALVFGRRTFDLTHGWGGNHPLDVPVFVASGSAPPAWVSESTWCRSCWGAASACSTTSAPGRSTWSARG